MCAVLTSLLAGLTSTLRTRASLQTEILALRHQLAILQRDKPRRMPLRAWDRLLWVALVRLWPEWRKALIPGQARDRYQLASQRIPVLLELEEP